MKIILAVILSFFFIKSAHTQSKSLINMANGDINICNENCCLTYYGTFPVFGDIAFGNNKIYGISDSLHVIDFSSKQILNSFSLNDINGNPLGSNALELVNDSLLFFESYAKLYSFNLHNNSIQLMGNIGYVSSGDLVFCQNKLFMTTNSSELIAINLNSSFSVINVSVIESDSISINSSLGMSRKPKSSELLLFNGSALYSFDVVLKEYHKICDIDIAINGAAFYEEPISESNFPNIITPNNDNINDFIDLSEFSAFSILNRWGEEVFNSTYSSKWRGEDKSGNPLNDGVYFIIVHFEDCAEKNHFSKPITIIR